MASEPNAKETHAPSPVSSPDIKGIRIFTYPKVIYLFPTLVVSLICGIGMLSIGDRTEDPTKVPPAASAKAEAGQPPAAPAKVPAKHDRFTTPQNLFAVLFLGVLGFNLLTMALDFPRFTILGGVLLVGFLVFFFLWLGAAFDIELMKWVRGVMASIYVYANAEFYFMTALLLSGIFLVVYLTRWLDYWQIMPNEILHHHGPLSDLERFPTMNLKFDKEIPDVLEFLLLGAGRLVLHVTEERKAIVLDNVLFINSVEAALKNLMSRMEVRVTTDQEVAGL